MELDKKRKMIIMNRSKLFKKSEETEFTTFPTTLKTYAWYKPILIAVITIIVTLAISFAALSIIGVNPKSSNIISLILSAVTMIILILGIYIGHKLIYKIPFSTQVAQLGNGIGALTSSHLLLH